MSAASGRPQGLWRLQCGPEAKFRMAHRVVARTRILTQVLVELSQRRAPPQKLDGTQRGHWQILEMSQRPTKKSKRAVTTLHRRACSKAPVNYYCVRADKLMVSFYLSAAERDALL